MARDQQKRIQSEFNNDYTGPAGVGYGGNEESLVRPLLGSGVGYDGMDEVPDTTNPGGMGRAGSETMPAPNRLGGDGRAGLPEPEGKQYTSADDVHSPRGTASKTTIQPVPMSLGANGE